MDYESVCVSVCLTVCLSFSLPPSLLLSFSLFGANGLERPWKSSGCQRHHIKISPSIGEIEIEREKEKEREGEREREIRSFVRSFVGVEPV
jgi:hypothetical protein